MAVSALELERRIAALEGRAPVQFSWSKGQRQPGVGAHAILFWEDTGNNRAKILMRRGLRVYVFESHEAGDAPPAVLPAVDIPIAVDLAIGDPGSETTRYALEDHKHQLDIAALRLPIRHLVYVSDAYGKAKTGATLTTALHRDSGSALVSASETVTATEIGSGDYRVSYTPTVRGSVYRLRVTLSGHDVTPGEFQDQALF